MKNNKGITITSLIITIIVMLILAGIALLFTVGEEGVIERAEKAEIKWNIAEAREQLDLLKNSELIENISKIEKTLYGDFSKYGIDIGKLQDKIVIEEGKLVYAPEKVTEEEAEYFESQGISKARHYIIVSEETKNTKYALQENVGTYENFVSVVNLGAFNPESKNYKYIIAYLEENIDLGNIQLEDGTWVDKNGNASVSIIPINTFNGILDGQGYIISGIYLDGSATAQIKGLITTNNGIIRNLSVDTYALYNEYTGACSCLVRN